MTILRRLIPVSACFTLPLLLLFLTGCAEQTTAPELDLTASFAKPGGNPGGGKPPNAQANPVLAIDGGGLFVADEDGGNKTMIYDPGHYFNPSWFSHGDGTPDNPYRILISAGIAGQIPMQIVEVVVENGVPRAGAVTEVLEDPWYVHAEVSPNGDYVVAVWVNGPPDFIPELRLIDLVTGEVETIFPAGEEGEVFRPEWNGDGSKVAFFEAVGPWPRATTLWILDPFAGGLTEVLTFTATTDTPKGVSWGRTSDQLVFDYDYTLFHVLLDEDLKAVGDPVSLGLGRGPVFSPDDTRIASEYRNSTRIKTLWANEKRDQRVLGGWWPDWRR